MGLPLVRSRAFDVRRELLLELIKGHVFLLFFFLSLAGVPLLNLYLIHYVQRASIISLQVGPPQHEDGTLLFNSLEEAVADLTDDISVDDSFEVVRDFLTQSHALLPTAHQVLNLFQVVGSSLVLMFFQHLHTCSAIVLPDMLNEVSTISNRFTFEREDKWTVSLIESIRTANLHIK